MTTPTAGSRRGGEPAATGLERPLKLVVLALLVGAPLAVGAVHEPAWICLLSGCAVVGAVSWARGHWARVHGADVPRVPGSRLIAAYAAWIALQLVPLPPSLLRLVSPGTFRFHDAPSLVPVTTWLPVSVSPADTLRGLLFVAGFGLLYAAVFREFDDPLWRRRLAWAILATSALISVEALLQAATGDTLIYGLWRPRWDFAVFGPYVNRNHFAGYVEMAVPLGLGLALEAAGPLQRSWARRKHGWLALGERHGLTLARTLAATITALVGLLTAQSRGGLLALATSAVVLLLATRRRLLAAAVVAAGLALAIGWVDLGGYGRGFERGLRGSRLLLWRDVLRMVPDFPVMGAGFNAFGTAYPAYQTIWKEYWWGEAHDEYLQVLVDTGIVGASLVAALLVRLFRPLLRRSERSGLEAGVLAALLAAAAHNIVDFNWQIPANAATWAALAGVGLRAALDRTPASP